MSICETCKRGKVVYSRDMMEIAYDGANDCGFDCSVEEYDEEYPDLVLEESCDGYVAKR